MRKLLTLGMIFSTLTLSTPRAHAITTLTWTTLGGLAVTAIAAYLVATSPPSIEASSKNKELAMNIVADDAAAFIMNGGVDASDLLVAMMSQMRNSEEFSSIKEDVTDLDLAHAILGQVTS